MKKKKNTEIGFNKRGQSLVVVGYHKQFSLIQLFFGLMNGALMFNAAFLKSCGLNATQVGGFISIASLIGMFAPMVWGMVSDKYKTVKRIVYICLCCMLVVYLPIPFYSKLVVGSLSLAPVFIIAQAAFSGAPEAMITAWIMQTQRQHPEIQYGFIRMFFTGAFALSNFMYMFIIEKTSYNAIFIGYATFALLIMLLLTRYPDAKPSDTGRPKSFKDMHVERIFKNRFLIIYVIFMVFACIPTSSLGLFTPYLIESIGGNASLLGGMIALRSVCAVPMLYFSNRFVRKLGPRNTLLIGSSLLCISQVVFAFCRTMPQAFANCALMGVGLGIMMPSEVSFVNEQAPDGLIATCQTVCGTVYSIAGILCSFLGGIVVDSLGIRNYYQIVVCLTAAAILFFFISTLILMKKQKAHQA
ncbi:MAG: MFS transporter [Oscillospiraceae bacterium]|nr:MFS transporter [Oscillospiraceae bacterium]